MEYFIMIDIDSWFILIEGFKALKDREGKLLDKYKWAKEQVQKSKTKQKVTKLIVDIIHNNILCKISEYQDAKEL